MAAETETESTTSETPVKTYTSPNLVLNEVAERLKNSGPVVRESLINLMTNREVTRRMELLDKACAKHRELIKEANKARRPEKKGFKLVDGKMQEAETVFTKEEADAYSKAVKEAEEKLTKLEVAMAKALDDNSWEKLTETVK